MALGGDSAYNKQHTIKQRNWKTYLGRVICQTIRPDEVEVVLELAL